MRFKPGNADLLIGVFSFRGPFIRSNSFIISAYGEISASCTISVQLHPRKSFRINIFETGTKQRALTSFGMNTFAKPQGGPPAAQHTSGLIIPGNPRLSKSRTLSLRDCLKFPPADPTVAPFTRLCDKGGFVHEIALQFLASCRHCGLRLLCPEFYWLPPRTPRHLQLPPRRRRSCPKFLPYQKPSRSHQRPRTRSPRLCRRWPPCQHFLLPLQHHPSPQVLPIGTTNIR